MSTKSKIIKTAIAIKFPFLVLLVLAFFVPTIDLPDIMLNGDNRFWFMYLTTVTNILTFATPLFTLGLIVKVGITIYFIWRK